MRVVSQSDKAVLVKIGQGVGDADFNIHNAAQFAGARQVISPLDSV
jgi:hypothetical protein